MSTTTSSPKAELLSIGDEILFGDIVDTNAAWLAQELRGLGVSVSHKQTVGDELSDIVAAFKLALSRSDLVLATGGLGPTDDDLTLQAVADALGVALEWREEVMDQMAERLKRPKEQLGGGNRKQANIPQGSIILRNHWGTAPGLRVPSGGRQIFLMPGVPREMKGLFEAYVASYMRETYPARDVILKTYLHSVGLGESLVGDRIKALMQPGRNPDVGTRVAQSIVSVRVVARAASEAAARELMAPTVAQVQEALGAFYFGRDDESLAEATVQALVSRGLTLAVAESCTAGQISAALGGIPGVSATLLEGSVAYSNEAKMRSCGVKAETLAAYGAVSEQTAKELAEGIRRRANADLAVSVTGIAGPDGGTPEKPVGLVWIGLATANGVTAEQKMMAGNERNVIRARSTMLAMDLVRREALKLPSRK
ncbi:MAG: CinA-like protein [Planctomycetota bacterium]